MKIEKILACVVIGLIILCGIVYFTLPKQGEQIYIPSVESVPEGIEIPEGYKLVDNYPDEVFTIASTTVDAAATYQLNHPVVGATSFYAEELILEDDTDDN